MKPEPEAESGITVDSVRTGLDKTSIKRAFPDHLFFSPYNWKEMTNQDFYTLH